MRRALRIAIAQQHPSDAQSSGLASRLPQALNDERFIRARRAPDHLDASPLDVEQERHVGRDQALNFAVCALRAATPIRGSGA